LDKAHGTVEEYTSIRSTVIYHPPKKELRLSFKFLVCVANELVVIGAINEN